MRYSSSMACFREIVAREGYRALFRFAFHLTNRRYQLHWIDILVNDNTMRDILRKVREGLMKNVTNISYTLLRIYRGAGVNIVRGVAGAGVLTSFDRYVTTITFFWPANVLSSIVTNFCETIRLTFLWQGEGVLHQQEAAYVTYAEQKLSNCHIVVIRSQHFWIVVQLWHLKTSHIALLVTCRDRRANQLLLWFLKQIRAVSDSRHHHCIT